MYYQYDANFTRIPISVMGRVEARMGQFEARMGQLEALIGQPEADHSATA